MVGFPLSFWGVNTVGCDPKFYHDTPVIDLASADRDSNGTYGATCKWPKINGRNTGVKHFTPK